MAKLTLNVLLLVYVTNFESRMLYNLVVTLYAFNHVNKLNTYYIILCLITCSERIKKENINGMHCNYRSRYNAIITHPMKNSAMSPLPPPPPPLSGSMDLQSRTTIVEISLPHLIVASYDYDVVIILSYL